MRVATIDVGTNTILLLIAEGPPAKVLADRSRIVRLGQDVDRTGALQPAAIERALAVLREYAAEARACDASLLAVGTQALREVSNADAFLQPARAILGCPVEVVDGQREAELAWRAVRGSFPELSDAIVMDVGGGSTELVVARGGRVLQKVSLKIGSVRLHERFLTHDPPTDDEMAQVGQAIDRELRALALPRGLPLVGIAGTVTTLAAMHAGIDPYDGERVHGMTLERAAVARQIERLRLLPLAERRQLRGLEPARADVILAGALIVAHVLSETGAPALRVSDRGVRWGLLYERLEGKV
ncbi:MAG TPA: Ppx/GppA phosphatase family protein [Polyangia bacterium]|nr:Ppx/GppA phosphatase family protein [Polyangia bacterium]